jgi:hypothetical protein
MSRLSQGYHLYQDPYGRFTAIAKFSPNRFVYTIASYARPMTALERVTYQQNNRGLVATATSGEINKLLTNLQLIKINRGPVNNKVFHHIMAASGLHRMSRRG